MPRLLVLNNYPLAEVWEEVRRGHKPDHHLFGLNYFEQWGYEVTIAPFQSSRLLQTLSGVLTRARFPVPLGDLDQQYSVMSLLNRADVIYCPCQSIAWVLGYLRAIHLLKKPLVLLAHHPFSVGRLAPLRRPFLKLAFRGSDRYPSLATDVAVEINHLAGDPGKSVALPWGPQRDFYPASEKPGSGAVAAGRTGRDFLTFARGAAKARVPARILCLQSSVTPELESFNVPIEAFPDGHPMDYVGLMPHLRSARVHAIPLTDTSSLSGLTSLMDALGLGKPVVMTRHPLIDINLESLGIGRWVEPGDAEGWSAVLRWFEEHPDEAAAMGDRARKLVDNGLDSMHFARRVAGIFEELLAHPENGS